MEKHKVGDYITNDFGETYQITEIYLDYGHLMYKAYKFLANGVTYQFFGYLEYAKKATITEIVEYVEKNVNIKDYKKFKIQTK